MAQTATFTVVPAAAPVDPLQALVRLPGTFLNAAAGLLAVALSPLLAPGPAAPAPPPTLFAVLAWVRREIDRNFFNSAPTVAYTATGNSQDVNGAVSGRVVITDRDGDPVTVSTSTPVNGGSVVVRPDGTFTYTPTVELARTGGVDSFTLTATSAGTGLHLQDVGAALARLDLVGALLALTTPPATRRVITVAVTPINQNPIARDDAFSVDEDTPLTGDVSLNDADPNQGDTRSYGVVSSTTQGSLVLRPDGTFDYTPSGNFFGTDSFTYSFSDRAGATATATATITVRAVNDAPVAAPGPQSVDYATGSVTGTVGFTDVDSPTLTYTVTQPSSGRVTFDAVTGRYVFTPTVADRLQANLTPGADSRTFTITASDGAASTPITITAEIDPARLVVVDSIPTGSSIIDVDATATRVYVIGRDGVLKTIDPTTNTVVGTLQITGVTETEYLDAGSDGRVYVSAGNGGNGTVVIVDTTTGTQTPVRVGGTARDLLEVTLPSGERLVYVTTRGTNANRVAIIDPTDVTNVRYVDLPGTVGPNNIAASPDGRYVYVTRNTGGAGLAVIDTATNTVVDERALGTNPTGLDVSADGRHVFVTNNSGTTLTIVDTVSGTQREVALGAASRGVRVSPDGSVAYVTLTNGQVAVVDTATGATIGAPVQVGQTPQYVAFTPDGTAFTSNFTVGSVSVLKVVSANVNAAPIGVRPPTVSTPNVTTGVVTGTLGVTDPDGNVLSYTPTSGSTTKGTFTVGADGTFTYRPTDAARHAAAAVGAPSSTSTDSFSVTVADGLGGTRTVTVVVTVGKRNAVPTSTGATAGTPAADGLVTGNLNVTDADRDPLTFVASTPTRGSVTVAADGSFTYRPTPAAQLAAVTDPTARTDTFTVGVSDGYGGSITVPVTVTIKPVNVAPVLGRDVFTVDAGKPLQASLATNDVDANGDTLTYAFVGQQGSGTLTLATDGSFTFTSNAAGTTVIAYDVSDGTNTVRGSASIVVVAVNAAPVAGDATFTTLRDTAVSGTLTVTDPDGPQPLFSAAGTTANGTVVVSSNGAFTYTPRSGFVGEDSFVFTVSDGSSSDTGTVTITVTPPVIVDPATPVTLGSPTTGSAAIDGAINTTRQGLMFSVASAPTYGTVRLAADGTFTYTPDPVDRLAAFATVGTADDVDVFTIRVSDGVSSQTVTVTPSVSPAPVAAIFGTPTGSTIVGTPFVDADAGVAYVTVRNAAGAYALVIVERGGQPRAVALPGTPIGEPSSAGDNLYQYTRSADGSHAVTLVGPTGAISTVLPGEPTDTFVDQATGTVLVVSAPTAETHAVTVVSLAGASTVELAESTPIFRQTDDGSLFAFTNSQFGYTSVVVIRTDGTTSTVRLGGSLVDAAEVQRNTLAIRTITGAGTQALMALKSDGTSRVTTFSGTPIGDVVGNPDGSLDVYSATVFSDFSADWSVAIEKTTLAATGNVHPSTTVTRTSFTGAPDRSTMQVVGSVITVGYTDTAGNPATAVVVYRDGTIMKATLRGSAIDGLGASIAPIVDDSGTIIQFTTLPGTSGERTYRVSIIGSSGRSLTVLSTDLPGAPVGQPVVASSGVAYVISDAGRTSWLTVLNSSLTTLPTVAVPDGLRPEDLATDATNRRVGFVVADPTSSTYVYRTVDENGTVRNTLLGGAPRNGVVVDSVSGATYLTVRTGSTDAVTVIAPDGTARVVGLPGVVVDGPDLDAAPTAVYVVSRDAAGNVAVTVVGANTAVSTAIGLPGDSFVDPASGAFVIAHRIGNDYRVTVVQPDGTATVIGLPGRPVGSLVAGSDAYYTTSVSGSTTTVTVVRADGTSRTVTVPGTATVSTVVDATGAYQQTDAGVFLVDLASPTSNGSVTV
ncbi:hypothetical protein BEL07_01340 [Mycolicibacterium grossiae]|uniref:RapA2 cadherin-like domain-containing protein n=2 Tax=Mycolicibacterium grossiae TaxID=1552759 RepID=A0A1E8QAY6_9MYCO|nr:hypothetical protein BEL07_01340 [Mycolicibacterium grossiae]